MQQLILIRGLPGVGKSTLAKVFLAGADEAFTHHETDHFFLRPDSSGYLEYVFDPSKLAENHANCLALTKQDLESGSSVVVSNTFCQRWEMEGYLKLYAESFEVVPGGVSSPYNLTVIDLFNQGYSDAALAKRTVHSVPVETIARMRSRYEHDWSNANPLPPWERTPIVDSQSVQQ